MMTPQQERDEFWLLSKGILQDSKIDTDEARVIRCWLAEHNHEGAYDFAIAKLDRQLSDGWIDRYESSAIIDAIGQVLRMMREAIGQAK